MKVACARVAVCIAAATAFTLGSITPAPAAQPTSQHRSGVRRVLVISVPALAWADVVRVHPPAIERLLSRSAIADMSTRVISHSTKPDDAYLTFGAGTRTEGRPGVDGVAVPLVGGGIAVPGMPAIVAHNRNLLYDARPGALGDALSAARWRAVVIADGDRGPRGAPGSTSHHEAVLGLADHRGRVPGGSVSDALLRYDPTAAFGRRLDPAAVDAELARSWDDHTVALVEASDLARADAAAAVAPPSERRRLVDGALRRTDDLVDRLLRRVDPAQDAVMLVAPYHSSTQVQLTVAALSAPDTPAGLLRSPTTRRAGFVQIVDAGPTVLDLAGIARPDAMEGRPFEAVRSRDTLGAKVRTLVDADQAARFRDAHLAAGTNIVVAASLALATATALVLALHRRRVRSALQLLALVLPGWLVGTFLARVTGFESRGTTAYWLYLLVFALGFAAVCALAGRGRTALPLGLALGSLAAVHVGDALTGARLELSTVFGYSPIVGIRLAGLGNMAYAQLAAASLVVSGLLAWRVRGRRGTASAIGLLAVALVTIAAPFWGQNFGGSLAAAPVFVVVGLLLSGRRVRARSIAVVAGTAVSLGLVIGFVDLLRPAASRTHVGRFFERVGTDGWHGFTLVIHRKANQSLGTLRHSMWTPMTIGGVLFLLFLLWYLQRDRGRGLRNLQDLRQSVPALWPFVVGVPALLVLGFALKDSGIAVPGMMLVVMTSAAAYLSLELARPD